MIMTGMRFPLGWRRDSYGRAIQLKHRACREFI